MCGTTTSVRRSVTTRSISTSRIRTMPPSTTVRPSSTREHFDSRRRPRIPICFARWTSGRGRHSQSGWGPSSVLRTTRLIRASPVRTSTAASRYATDRTPAIRRQRGRSVFPAFNREAPATKTGRTSVSISISRTTSPNNCWLASPPGLRTTAISARPLPASLPFGMK